MIPLGLLILPFLITLGRRHKEMTSGHEVHILDEELNNTNDLIFVTPSKNQALDMTFNPDPKSVIIHINSTDEEFERKNKEEFWWNTTVEN